MILERVHINRNVRIAKRIFRRTRQFFADILYVFQEKLTKLCGKSAARRALSACVNTLYNLLRNPPPAAGDFALDFIGGAITRIDMRAEKNIAGIMRGYFKM